MSAPKSQVSVHQDEVTPDETQPDAKPNIKKPSSKTSSEASSKNSSRSSSVDNTREPRHTYKAAFFNFIRDLKKKHKNKNYQSIMTLGSRKWRSMTQAQRAPYVLEAAKNRKLEQDHHHHRHHSDKNKTKKGEKRKSREDTPVPNKRSKTEDGRPRTTKSGRCAACGKRRKEPSRAQSCASSGSVSSGSSKSNKSI